MFALKIFVLSIALICVSCRQIVYKDVRNPRILFIEDSSNILEDDIEDALSEPDYESVYPRHLNNLRVRRQLGSATMNSDQTMDLNAKVPLVGNNRNQLSAIASVNGLRDSKRYGAVSGGLLLENANRHALSLTEKHIPGFGNQLTAAGKLNLFHNDKHDVNANAFYTKNMPHFPNVPNFGTKGGSLDYTFNNKVGASLGMAQTDFLQRKDYSATGNLNLFRNPTSSFDFNAGFTKSVAPYIPDQSWKPNAGFSFTKFF